MPIPDGIVVVEDIVVDEGIVVLEVMVVDDGIVLVDDMVVVEGIVVVEVIWRPEVMVVDEVILGLEVRVAACAAAAMERMIRAESTILCFIFFSLDCIFANTLHVACQNRIRPYIQVWRAFAVFPPTELHQPEVKYIA